MSTKTYEVRVGNCERYLGHLQPNIVVLTMEADNEEDAESKAYAYMYAVKWGGADTDWSVSTIKEV
jgi:hypothetical protein